jgi:hypothetical protein
MIRRHLSYANVVSTLALFLVLGGGAYALSKNSVGSRAIKNDSIRSKDIKDRQIRGRDIRDDTVTARQIEEGRFDLSRFVAMNSGQRFSCSPPGPGFVTCAETTLNLQEPSQVLLVAGGTADSATPSEHGSAGSCRLTVDGARAPGLPAELPVGEETGSASAAKANGFSVTGATNPAQLLREGRHRFGLECRELDGNVRFNTQISALALGGTP